MFIPSLLPVLVFLTAVLARRAPVIAVRRPQDGSSVPSPDPNTVPTGPRVLLVSPTSLGNSSLVYNTCDPVYLWWFYDNVYRYQLQTDAFNLTITNVGVDQDPPPPATSTSSDAGSTSSSSSLSRSISSVSNPGTFPPTFLPLPEPTESGDPPPVTQPTQDPTSPVPGTRRRLTRRSDITLVVAHDLPVIQDNHYFYWPAISVPSGYYVLHGTSTRGSSIPYADSPAFYIGEGSTACFSSSPSAPSSGDDSGSGSPPPSSGSTSHVGVIAGAIVGVVLGLLALSGVAFLFLVRRRRGSNGGPWGHVSSTDSRRPRAIGLPVGPVRRLPHPADPPAEYERESFDEEKNGMLHRSGSGSTGRSAVGALPMARPTSEAYALSMLAAQSHSQTYSHSQSRRSTLQSIPTTVTPTDTPPSPVSPVALARANSTSGAPRRAARKPVPVYDAADESRETLPGSETDLGLAPPTEMSSSHRSDTGLLSGFPFELDGAKGQVHYLIPDPPLAPSRR